jgi:hypothetical protein
MHRKRTLKVLSILIGICILLGAALYIHSYIDKPSVGSVTYPNPISNNQSSYFNMAPVRYSGTYASFSYPKSLSTYPSSKPVSPVLANYSFIYRSEEQWFLSVTILDIPGGSLSANNAYQVRQLYPNQYQPSVIRLNGQNIQAMTDMTADGYSKVAFLVNDKYQATVSLTADEATDPNLAKTLNLVLSSWHWN